MSVKTFFSLQVTGTLAKKDIPDLITIHCICHQANLIVKNLYDQYMVISTFNNHQSEIIKFLKYSLKKIIILHEVEVENDYKKHYKLLKEKAIRSNWFHYATNRIIELYIQLVKGLECGISNPKLFEKDERIEAKNIKEKMLRFKFCYLLHFLSDFLSPISILIKRLQERVFDVADLQETFYKAITTIELQYTIWLPIPKNSVTKNVKLKEIIDYGGFYLSDFLEHCYFDNEDNAPVSYKPKGRIKIIQLSYDKEDLVKFQTLVYGAASCMINSLTEIIPYPKTQEG